MKKIFILSILFAMISCSEQPDTNVYHTVEKTNDVYVYNVNEVHLRTVVIDSCEYLIGSRYEPGTGYGYLSHKGNCKYVGKYR